MVHTVPAVIMDKIKNIWSHFTNAKYFSVNDAAQYKNYKNRFNLS